MATSGSPPRASTPTAPQPDSQADSRPDPHTAPRTDLAPPGSPADSGEAAGSVLGEPKGGGISDEEAFFAMSSEMFCTATMDTGYFVRLSGSWTATLGYSEEELRAVPYMSFVHPDDHASTLAIASKLSQGQQLVSFINRYRKKDGSLCYLEWSASLLKGRQLSVAVARDVTERVETAEQLRYNETILQEVSRGAPIIISAYDLQGRITASLGAGLKRLGLTPNQVKGALISEIFQDIDPSLQAIRDAMDGRESRNTQELNDSVWDNWFSPIRDPQGQITGVIAISTDATERERARKMLEERLRLIEEQNRLIRDLTVPIIEIWQGVLVLPVMGQLERERAQSLTNRLLEAVAARRARYAILDLTAVEIIDTATAQHLVQMVQALRLLGTQGLLSGIRSSVAQAVVGLGVDLSQVVTVASLHAALRLCMNGSSQL